MLLHLHLYHVCLSQPVPDGAVSPLTLLPLILLGAHYAMAAFDDAAHPAACLVRVPRHHQYISLRAGALRPRRLQQYPHSTCSGSSCLALRFVLWMLAYAENPGAAIRIMDVSVSHRTAFIVDLAVLYRHRLRSPYLASRSIYLAHLTCCQSEN